MVAVFKHKPPTGKDLETLIEILTNQSQRAAKDHFGVSQTTIQRWVKLLNLNYIYDLPGKRGRKIGDKELRSAWEKHRTVSGVANELCIDRGRARRMIKEMRRPPKIHSVHIPICTDTDILDFCKRPFLEKYRAIQNHGGILTNP